MKYISTQLGHSSININMDRYGHLFNDKDFNRSQVELLETVFEQSVRQEAIGIHFREENSTAVRNKKGIPGFPRDAFFVCGRPVYARHGRELMG